MIVSGGSNEGHRGRPDGLDHRFFGADDSVALLATHDCQKGERGQEVTPRCQFGPL